MENKHLFVLKARENGGKRLAVTREIVNENYFVQFINTHEINEKSNINIISIIF